MTRLTREVRFTLPFDGQVPDLAVANSFSGNLVDSPGMYLVLQVTLRGGADPLTSYIENIKNIDRVVREAVAPALTQLVQTQRYTLARAAQRAAAILHQRWPGRFDHVRLSPNPYLACEVADQEHSMVYLTQRFEFSAAHRLHNPAVDEQRNRELFGRCNNPAGHGHNYELDVTLAGSPDPAGQLISPDQFAQIVGVHVVERFDHKYLNTQTSEFASTIPTVENIARVIHGLLDGQFPAPLRLHSVKVWETGKTWAEYSTR